MAALVTEEYMRATFKIHKDVVADRITPYIAVASLKLKAWVGATYYTDSTLADVLKLAEGSLAMSFLTLNLNTNVRPQGLIKVERVEGNTVVQYLSPTETAQTSVQWFEQAETIVRGLFQTSDIPPAPEFIENETIFQGDAFCKWQT